MKPPTTGSHKRDFSGLSDEMSFLRGSEAVHEFLHHGKSCRTVGYVLLVPLHVVGHLLPGKMRESGTVPRTYLVDAAHVGLQVEELTGLLSVHPVAAFIVVEPFLLERITGHAQVRRDAFDVLRRESRGHLPAAVGACEAIRFLPYFTVDLHGHGIESAGRIFFQPGEECPHFFLTSEDLLPERTKVDRFHLHDDMKCYR